MTYLSKTKAMHTHVGAIEFFDCITCNYFDRCSCYVLFAKGDKNRIERKNERGTI